jgi:hypothetical protein
MLHHFFPAPLFFNLKLLLTLNQSNSIKATAAGAAFGCAYRTAPNWLALRAQLGRALEQFLPYIQVLKGRRSKEFWDSSPTVDHLFQAINLSQSTRPELSIALQAELPKLLQSKQLQHVFIIRFPEIVCQFDFPSEIVRRLKLRSS